MTDIRGGYKVLTYDWSEPKTSHEPICDGNLPADVPAVELDTSTGQFPSGWSYSATAADAFRVGGLWPEGRPARLVVVSASDDAVERGGEYRATSLTLIREATPAEVEGAILELSRRFGPHASVMAQEQLAWLEALSRPEADADRVEAGLRQALKARGLEWTLRRFENAKAAWEGRDFGAKLVPGAVRTTTAVVAASAAAADAGAAWGTPAYWEAFDGWATWDAGEQDAWDIRNVWDAWATLDARDAWTAWDLRKAFDGRSAEIEEAWAGRGTAGSAWDMRVAQDARVALIVCFASLQGWIKAPPDLLTVGVREAYRYGLGLVQPNNPSELGWGMALDVSGPALQTKSRAAPKTDSPPAPRRERSIVTDLGELGFFFSYAERETAERDYASFCRTAEEATDRPCNFFLSLAEWRPRRYYPYVIAMILPEEYEHQVSDWLSTHSIGFGDDVEASRNVSDFYENTRSLEPSRNFFRSRQ